MFVNMMHDSTKETLLHIRRVNSLLISASCELLKRAKYHDQTKLSSPEKEVFDEYTDRLKECTYGSEEYHNNLKHMRAALDHHYENNSHHPEHYADGIDGMNLFDLIEMILDWKAASERHNNGDIRKSLEINTERFDISPQLRKILENTIEDSNFF